MGDSRKQKNKQGDYGMYETKDAMDEKIKKGKNSIFVPLHTQYVQPLEKKFALDSFCSQRNRYIQGGTEVLQGGLKGLL